MACSRADQTSSDKEGNVEYAQGIADRLTSLGMRVTVDSRDENIGPKIKAARLERIPYILVIGDNEMNSSTVTVRSRKEEKSRICLLTNLLLLLRTK